jgi:hypothetical protein
MTAVRFTEPFSDITLFYEGYVAYRRLLSLPHPLLLGLHRRILTYDKNTAKATTPRTMVASEAEMLDCDPVLLVPDPDPDPEPLPEPPPELELVEFDPPAGVKVVPFANIGAVAGE